MPRVSFSLASSELRDIIALTKLRNFARNTRHSLSLSPATHAHAPAFRHLCAYTHFFFTQQKSSEHEKKNEYRLHCHVESRDVERLKKDLDFFFVWVCTFGV
jgi:hypothetical protein